MLKAATLEKKRNKKMLDFCVKHGVEVNRWPIFEAVERAEAVVAAVKSRLRQPSTECSSSKQLTLTLGPRSAWTTR